MKYSSWEVDVPEELKRDALWRVEAYRLALFLSDIAWQDVLRLAQDRKMRSLSDQLYRAAGSISANIAEGFSMGTGKNRARFYEYALGSARESRDWYFKSRYVLGDEIARHRIDFLTRIIRLLLTMIPHQRQSPIREPEAEYRLLNSKIPG